MARSIGIIECDCLSAVVSAADRMVKTGEIRLVQQEQVGELVVEGDTDEVERALGAAKGEGSTSLTTTLVASIHPQVLSLFVLPGGRFWNRG